MATQPDFTIRQGTTRPIIRATLIDDTNVPVDLSGAPTVTLELYYRGELVVNGAADIIAGNETLPEGSAEPNVEYTWVEADTAERKLYNALWRVVWGVDESATFPSAGYFTVEVAPLP
jgi:hypothetical protein